MLKIVIAFQKYYIVGAYINRHLYLIVKCFIVITKNYTC